jgi:purine-binding chemotaxis protein CheW
MVSRNQSMNVDKESVEIRQLLTFLLDLEVYGADISQIQEVLEYRKVTKVPRTPEFMLGVINLRGQVVPVIDLRRLFSMAIIENTVNTCIVIVDVTLDGEQIPLGILADAVKEVIELSAEDISPPPRLGHRIDTRFIDGIGKNEEEFIIILELSRVIADDELHDLVHSTQEFNANDIAED